jgi:hypothetical protein
MRADQPAPRWTPSWARYHPATSGCGHQAADPCEAAIGHKRGEAGIVRQRNFLYKNQQAAAISCDLARKGKRAVQWGAIFWIRKEFSY